METIFTGFKYAFREPGKGPHSSEGKPGVDEKPVELPSDGDTHLVCVQCLQIVTNTANKIIVDGAHSHTFANPHGIIFEIGCFGAAPGCGTTGPATDDFSWFRGYQWKIALCRRCLTHLGWQFISGTGLFYGLISDRLMELTIDDGA